MSRWGLTGFHTAVTPSSLVHLQLGRACISTICIRTCSRPDCTWLGRLCAAHGWLPALAGAIPGKDEKQRIFDIAVVAAGFVLGAVAGGLAASIFPSPAFLAVTASVAPFVVAGARYSEISWPDGSTPRGVLHSYSPGYLRFVWSVSIALAVTYCILWALELWSRSRQAVVAYSAIPFCLILLRYARDIDAGVAEDPEGVTLRDRPLIALVVGWLVLFLWHVPTCCTHVQETGWAM